MVRRSALVYDLLRTEQPTDGFSKNEILTHISDKYGITVGKALRRDITVALRRGLDFATTRKNTNTKKRKKNSKKKATSRSNITKGRRQQRRRSPNSGRDRGRKQSNPVPEPKLPRPPSWSPKRRFLIEEPIPRAKHF
ncbi:hypothetical protein G5I_03248 [Acromyrmex echinatior]|uniref:Uncharacterized protein n=1 Tax=Acromyrmex echinatior TaxID=103372 RepID=F4WCH2_ACREC|nr:hypothetical protein G5I_03248 [Acromyrmex echinatior]